MEIERTMLDICKVYYKELENKGEKIPAKAIRELVIEFTESTNNILQSNTDELSTGEVSWIQLQVKKYSDVLNVLDAIDSENVIMANLTSSITFLKTVYDNHQLGFEQRSNRMEPTERRNFIDSILVPYMMVIYHLRRCKRNILLQ